MKLSVVYVGVDLCLKVTSCLSEYHYNRIFTIRLRLRLSLRLRTLVNMGTDMQLRQRYAMSSFGTIA